MSQILDGNSAAEREYQYQQSRPRTIEEIELHYAREAIRRESKMQFVKDILNGKSVKCKYKPNLGFMHIGDALDTLPETYNLPLELDIVEEYKAGKFSHIQEKIIHSVLNLADEVFGE